MVEDGVRGVVKEEGEGKEEEKGGDVLCRGM